MVSLEKCPGRQREKLARVIARCQRIMSLPETCHAPVIAAVHGKCIGAGVDLISACDLRYCTSGSVFNVKEADLAIVADLGTLQRLPGIVGEQRTRELAFTSRNVSSSEAQNIGLVLQAYPDLESLMSHVKSEATHIAKKSTVTIRGVKKCLNYGRNRPVEEGLEYVLRWNEGHLLSADLDAAVQNLSNYKIK